MILLDGKKIKNEILDKIKNEISINKMEVGLAIVLIGNDEASEIYVKNKIKACEFTGIKPSLFTFEEHVLEEEIINLIKKLNNDAKINGIIIQSPLPEHIDFKKCVSLIDFKKDVDGLSMLNTYKNYNNELCLLPCTVKGIIELLKNYDITLEGKDIVIVGKGALVGKPLSLSLSNLGATVTLCHSKTNNLKEKTLNADILISATGQDHLIKEDMVKNNAVVIDVGITRKNGKIIGDVDFENVKDKCSFITPVPGGVGPMTVAMIIQNVVEAYKMQDGGLNG